MLRKLDEMSSTEWASVSSTAAAVHVGSYLVASFAVFVSLFLWSYPMAQTVLVCLVQPIAVLIAIFAVNFVPYYILGTFFLAALGFLIPFAYYDCSTGFLQIWALACVALSVCSFARGIVVRQGLRRQQAGYLLPDGRR